MRPPAAFGPEPVRWRRPTGPYLFDRAFRRGRPPFDPFPVVTQVMKGYCPVALHLDQLWGRTWGGRVDTGLGDPIGPLYHDIVAEYRMRLAWGVEEWNPHWNQATFRARLHAFLTRWVERRGANQTTQRRLWDKFFQVMDRKRREEELDKIRGTRLLAEVTFVNPRCPFPIDPHRRHYPIRGRVDELNLDQGVIIERTLESDLLTGEPPAYKLFQAWLCAWSLRNLEDHLRPAGFERLWEGPLHIRVEAPDRDYEVALDQTAFMPWVAQAYYWIQALYRNRGQAAGAAYQNAACTIDHPDDACMHCRIDCFTRRPAYPTQRQVIGRICSSLARALLYDRLWDEDLWYYRQALLPEAHHCEEGARIRLPVIDVQQDRVRIQLGQRDDRLRVNRTFLAVASSLGNFSIGKWLQVVVVDVDQRNVVTLRVPGSWLPAVHVGDLLELMVDAPESTVLLFREPLGHLKDIQRQRLARVRRVGADSLVRGQRSGVTNTLRAIAREEAFEGV